ncbi:MAG: hypothetical protein AAFV33_00585 [Chloroflexota bacterium]
MAQEHLWIDDVFEYYRDDVLEHVVVIEFHRNHTWQEYYLLLEAIYDFIDGQVDGMDYINIWHRRITLPAGKPTTHYQNMIGQFNSPFIVTVDYSRNRVMQRLLLLVRGILKLNVTFAPDVETARDMIRLRREQSPAAD